ncbi:MAG TPA: CoA pyrophosphatase [Acidimicrobiia bacterium]|nr:CoA pyrophosphatase [Acidimicrobiia bacterium]
MSGRGGGQRIPRPPAVRVGGPAPWSHVPPDERRLTLAHVRERCAALPPPQPPAFEMPGSRPAGVLVPLFESGGEAHVILTKRPETMPTHQGEISFPGGGLHHGVDMTPCDAALREAEEEIALPPGAVDVVAELDTLATVGSRFTITPFVGIVDALPPLVPNPREVVKILEVPLSELLDDEAFHEEYWGSLDRAISFFELPGETVWGATARVLVAFLAHLTARP